MPATIVERLLPRRHAIADVCVIRKRIQRSKILSERLAVLFVPCELRHGAAQQLDVREHCSGKRRIPAIYPLTHRPVSVDGVTASALVNEQVAPILNAGSVIRGCERRPWGKSGLLQPWYIRG